MRDITKGTIIQFERKGFYICDRAFDANQPEDPMVFIYIPDGKEQNVGIKSGSIVTKDQAKSSDKKSSAEKSSGKKDGTKQPASSMYSIENVYGKIAPLDPKTVSGMYTIKPIVDVDLQFAPSSVGNATKGKKAKKDGKKAPAAPAEEATASPLSRLDLVVGKIVAVKKHPGLIALGCANSKTRILSTLSRSTWVKLLDPVRLCLGWSSLFQRVRCWYTS